MVSANLVGDGFNDIHRLCPGRGALKRVVPNLWATSAVHKFIFRIKPPSTDKECWVVIFEILFIQDDLSVSSNIIKMAH